MSQKVTIIAPFNPANPYDGWTEKSSYSLTMKGIEEAVSDTLPGDMLLVGGCQPFDTTCPPRKIIAEAKRAAKEEERESNLVPVLPDSTPSYALQHAGPFPVGSTWVADIPKWLTLAQLGDEMLTTYGKWIFGGRWRGDGWEEYATATAESEGVEFQDFEVFTLGPGKEPIVFALAIEFNSDAQLVLNLYMDHRVFTGTLGKPGENLLKFQKVFATACKTMRSKADMSGEYPGGVTWDSKTGIGRSN